MSLRIGQGFDVHAFSEGRKLILGGVHVPYARGLAGHSDADVLTHAVCDALLGAAGLGDIGHFFPDTDDRHKDADSLELLIHVMHQVDKSGLKVVNIDATVLAQEPKLAPYMTSMKKNLAGIIGVDVSSLGIKASTTEHLGFTGRKEGIAAMAVVLLETQDVR
ncbi:MAG: 2-C-methyl-D-erythritol 2,4-cyclodiphosphate synthase [Mariprofundaceae bacterium]|nr:2-C-methyl-D-erythritol 2,4-cyclodiphosphate synthase [Mariprofundaceae bacterium]